MGKHWSESFSSYGEFLETPETPDERRNNVRVDAN